MSARMEDLPRLRRRFPRRRLFAYSALGLIALAIIAILIGRLYIRSERFNRFLSIELEKTLEVYGLRAEAERVEPEFGASAVTLRNLKLFNQRTGQLIATIGRAKVSITIHDPFALRLRREIVFDKLELDGVDLWIVVDERGQSNFQGLRRPPPLRSRITFDYSKLAGSLSRSAIHFIDRKRDLQGDLRDLTGEGRPVEGADTPKVGVRLASGPGSIAHNEHKMAIESIELIGRAMESGAEIERLALRAPSLWATASGRLDDWRSMRYQLDTRAWGWIEEVLALFAPTGAAPGAVATVSPVGFKGDANFNGRIEGEGSRWSASGRAGSDELVAYGVKLRAAQAERARLESHDGQWTFSIGQARARSVSAESVELTTATASNVKGAVVNGQARITADQATVASIKTGGTGETGKTGQAGWNEFNGITLRNVSATYESSRGKGHWSFSSAMAQTRSGGAGAVRGAVATG
ncbi:MAG: hypothetical protein J2P52_08660, partial [Blastocatellia bacterium]|nr:hypothetical protein [Blastocatellia bacterium]